MLDFTRLMLISTQVEVGVEVGVELGNNNDNDKNNPHLNFLKGTVLGDMEQKIVLLLVANGVVSMIGDHSGTSLLKLQMG